MTFELLRPFEGARVEGETPPLSSHSTYYFYTSSEARDFPTSFVLLSSTYAAGATVPHCRKLSPTRRIAFPTIN